MPKKSNRDNFNDETIKRAGERVCLHCSLCGCLTKAASSDGNDQVSNMGEASHICAAAPGGPRYDPAMTSTQRKSIDNCIWLCKNHARLIDTDEKKYPKEFLLAKKKEAEERTAKALAEGRSSFSIIQNEGFSIEQTEKLLDETIINGEYFKLKVLLDSMSQSIKTEDFQDLYDYYLIVYSFYCDRENLKEILLSYISKTHKKYIDQLIALFIQFFEKGFISIILDSCTDHALKCLAQYVVNDALEGTIIFEDVDNSNIGTISISIESSFVSNVVHKLITNYAIEKGISVLKNGDGSELSLYDKEFYYKQKVMIEQMSRKVLNLITIREQKINDFSEYEVFNRNIHKIKLLTPELQFFFWRRLLDIANALHDQEFYKKLYGECNERLRENIDIKELTLIHEIEVDVESVDFREVRKICDAQQRYFLAHIFINEALKNNSTKLEQIISEHRYFLTTESLFLEDYIRIKKAKKASTFSAFKFLEEFRSTYKNDIIYHILVAFYTLNNKKYRCVFKKEIEWIEENINDFVGIPLNILDKLIIIFSKSNNIKKLLELDKLLPPVGIRMQIANCLQNTNEYIEEAKIIYLDILKTHKDIIGLNRCLCACFYNLRDMAQAKNYLCREIELQPNKEDIYNLLAIRLETKEFIFDEYFERAKKIKDAKIFYLIGTTYLQNKSTLNEARRYLLSSLLMDDNNLDCLGLYNSLCLMNEKSNKPIRADIGVSIRLENESKTLWISIEDDDIVADTPAKFAYSLHYKESDKALEDIIFSKVGDQVIYKGKNYKVAELERTDNIVFAYSMQKLMEDKRAFSFQADTAEKGIQNLKEWLNKRSAYLDNIVKNYNEISCSLPITLFSVMMGKKFIETYSFILYENPKRLRNLYSKVEITPNDKFILSFETIYILAILDIDVEILQRKKCFIPLMTKRIMLAEINEIIEECRNNQHIGYIFVKEGTLYREDDSEKKRQKRLKFFNRLKRLVESLDSPEKEYTYPYDDEIKKLFIERKLFLEGDLIGFVQNSTDTILVNDDMFISCLVSMHQIKAVGMNKFLTLLDIEVVQHIDYIQQLAQLNFGNYVTKDVYQHLKKAILNEKDEVKQNEKAEKFWNFLTSQFLAEGSDNWKYNNLIVREILTSNNIKSMRTDIVDCLVIKAVSYNYSREFPKEYKLQLEELRKRFRVNSYLKDGELIIETYLEESSGE